MCGVLGVFPPSPCRAHGMLSETSMPSVLQQPVRDEESEEFLPRSCLTSLFCFKGTKIKFVTIKTKVKHVLGI